MQYPSHVLRTIVCAIALSLFAQHGHAAVIFEALMEHSQNGWNNWEGGDWNGVEAANPDSITRSTLEKRAGSYSARFILNKTDAYRSGSLRAELTDWTGRMLNPKSERWYGLSMFLPTSYVTDPCEELVFQWHGDGELDLDGASMRNPAMGMHTVNGRWSFFMKYGGKFDLGAYETGKWTDWVLHIKFSPDGLNGVVEIWKNGQLVLSRTGRNTYNDNVGNYFKLGIYKYGWAEGYPTTTSRRELFHDEFRVGDANSSYAEVAPRGSVLPPTPSPTPSPSSQPTPAPSPSGVPPGANLVANSGFESGISSWEIWENTSVVASNAASGINSLRTGIAGGGAAQVIATAPVVGRDYQISASAMVTVTGDRGVLFLDALDAAGATILSRSVTIASTSYQTVSNSINVPPGTTTLKVWIWKDAGAGYLHLDNVRIFSAVTDPGPIPTVSPTPVPSPSSSPIPPPPVSDTIAPSVSITSPVNGSVIASKSTVSIAASASDNVGVSRVEFYVSGALRCTDSVAPYTCAWSVPGKRGAAYRIQARAFDAAGNQKSSPEAVVTAR